MAEEKVTLKRTVTIKAVVTEDFRRYLVHELNGAIRNLENKVQAVVDQGKNLLKTMQDQGLKDQARNIKQQVEMERQQAKAAIEDLKKRIEDAKNLPLGSEFVQGTVDGFVDIKKGENLYKALGALEIIIKDGDIQDIRNMEGLQSVKPPAAQVAAAPVKPAA